MITRARGERGVGFGECVVLGCTGAILHKPRLSELYSNMLIVDVE